MTRGRPLAGVAELVQGIPCPRGHGGGFEHLAPVRHFPELDLLFRQGQAPGVFSRRITLRSLAMGNKRPRSRLVEQHAPLSGPEESHPLVEVPRSHSAFFLRAVEEQPRKEEE